MRIIFLFCLACSCFLANGQNCKSNIDIKVSVCGTKLPKDSAICITCEQCHPGLIASDSNYSIISYYINAAGDGFDGGIVEALNQGAAFGVQARQILMKVRPGSFVTFTCIKAKYKNQPAVYILQPLFLELK